MSESLSLPDDFVDIVMCLNAEAVDFVIVGAHALAVHGAPRATGDLDILVRPTPENSERVYRALVEFGAPIAAHGLTAADFQTPGSVYQMGLPPHRIDVGTISDDHQTGIVESRSREGVDCQEHTLPGNHPADEEGFTSARDRDTDGDHDRGVGSMRVLE